eukprot:914908-Rhodomonas_salina.1
MTPGHAVVSLPITDLSATSEAVIRTHRSSFPTSAPPILARLAACARCCLTCSRRSTWSIALAGSKSGSRASDLGWRSSE